MKLPRHTADVLLWALVIVGPTILTVVLVPVTTTQRRDYVFLYLGLVAVLGVLRGFWPALAAAVVSFLMVDYFFVPPVYTFTIADEQDIVNLLAFLATAGVVGLLASQRRRALLQSERLTRNLRQTNAELARLNKEQAAAAQAALAVARSQEQVRALQEVDRARRELLANVSHELRTPLATILTESTSPPEAADADRRLHAIAGEAQRLKALVDDMLDLAVIESGTLELRLEPVRLGDAIEAAVERLHRTSPDREVRWDEAAAGMDVLADWSRLLQVLDNLLANADRFGPPGTPIELSFGPDGPGLVAVRVRDHGPGVAPEVRPRLFERFVHGPAMDGASQHAGTGLGLAIVKGLVEAHAGSVALEDVDGSGASFRFTLPVVEDAV
ncbi:MAG TPA: ATP-binding protein [Terriglobales bacterium]|nr:ATP-binding protein [Terriglobales bacterium]